MNTIKKSTLQLFEVVCFSGGVFSIVNWTNLYLISTIPNGNFEIEEEHSFKKYDNESVVTLR